MCRATFCFVLYFVLFVVWSEASVDSLGFPCGVADTGGWSWWLVNNHTLALLCQRSGKSPFSIPRQEGPWFLRARTPNAALPTTTHGTLQWLPRKRWMGGRAIPCSPRLCSRHTFNSPQMRVFSVRAVYSVCKTCTPEGTCSHGCGARFWPRYYQAWPSAATGRGCKSG